MGTPIPRVFSNAWFKTPREDRIEAETCLMVQTDEYCNDKFKDTILEWADQNDGPVHVDIHDYADLQHYCERSPYRLCDLLQAVRERCEVEGIESIIFF